MTLRDLQSISQAPNDGESMAVILPFPVAGQRKAINTLGHSESDAGAGNVSQEELQMALARDALRLILEELEAIRTRAADAITLR